MRRRIYVPGAAGHLCDHRDILSALAVSALFSAVSKAQMTGTMNNARQLYLAQFQMANDGSAISAATLQWPGDYAPPIPDLETYVNKLVGGGYLKGGDVARLLSAPGASLTLTVSGGSPQSVNFTGGTAALKVHPCHDADRSNTIFCTSHNYVYNSAIVNSAVPLRNKRIHCHP